MRFLWWSVFCNVMPYSLIDKYQYFWRVYWLHLQDRKIMLEATHSSRQTAPIYQNTRHDIFEDSNLCFIFVTKKSSRSTTVLTHLVCSNHMAHVLKYLGQCWQENGHTAKPPLYVIIMKPVWFQKKLPCTHCVSNTSFL